MRRPPYKLYSLLLQYPGEELLAAEHELDAAIKALPRSQERTGLDRFWNWFSTTSSAELQEFYVATFDLQKRSSLYLTFFSEGDTRKRGQSLLRLKHLYAAAGLKLESRELPDYLPVVLEFAELAPEGLGRHLLGEHRAGLEMLRLHLTELDSPYRYLIEGICSGLPRLSSAELEVVGRLLKQGPPIEQVGLQPFAPPEVMPLQSR